LFLLDARADVLPRDHFEINEENGRVVHKKVLHFRIDICSVRGWENMFGDGTRGVFAIGHGARFWENARRANCNPTN
jgi:hypothetical protein